MAINKASLIVVKGNHLLNATIVASLAILLSSAGVTHMPNMLGPMVRVTGATKAIAIKAVVWLWLGLWAGLLLVPCYGCL